MKIESEPFKHNLIQFNVVVVSLYFSVSSRQIRAQNNSKIIQQDFLVVVAADDDTIYIVSRTRTAICINSTLDPAP